MFIPWLTFSGQEQTPVRAYMLSKSYALNAFLALVWYADTPFSALA